MSLFSQRRSASSLLLPEEICSACCGHALPEICSVRGCRPHEVVKTRLSVRNICCDAEVRLIKRILEPLKGVETAHCPIPCCLAPEAILDRLNKSGLGAALLGQGAGADDDIIEFDFLLWFQLHIRHLSVLLSGLLLIIGNSVVIATGGAVAQGEMADAALVIVLYNLAKVIEQIAMSRVSKAFRASEQYLSGDVISLRPGEECPADGVVTRGSASCSEAAITGEARPVEKKKQHKIASGCVILNGYVEVTLTKDYSNSTLSQIEAKVEEAQMQRTGKQLVLERFARIWTPVVLLTVLIVCTVVPLSTGESFHDWIHRGLVILLTACPCAIVIGAPLATTCAIAAAATRGVLIKKPQTVELLPSIRSAGLDKTGTLTKGDLDPLKMAAAVEMKSAHPISAAIVSKAVGCVGEAFETADEPAVKKFKNLPGVGAQGNVSFGSKTASVLVGNHRVLEAVADPGARSMFANFQRCHPHDTTVAVVVNGTLRLGMALNDTIRSDAAKVVEELNALGCEPVMLTGDAEAAGRHVAIATGLDPSVCYFSMHPEDKHDWVQKQEDSGKPALMLGDGINDATALAIASVGVAMGETSAALAANSADMVMMTDKLQRLSQCIRLCRYAVWIERLNIILPCLVKIVEVGFALFGYLALWMAIVADLGGLLLVLILGLSVLSQRFWREIADSPEYADAELQSRSILGVNKTRSAPCIAWSQVLLNHSGSILKQFAPGELISLTVDEVLTAAKTDEFGDSDSRLRLTGADVKIHIFYTNKGYCQMDLKSDRIRIKSNNGLLRRFNYILAHEDDLDSNEREKYVDFVYKRVLVDGARASIDGLRLCERRTFVLRGEEYMKSGSRLTDVLMENDNLQSRCAEVTQSLEKTLEVAASVITAGAEDGARAEIYRDEVQRIGKATKMSPQIWLDGSVYAGEWVGTVRPVFPCSRLGGVMSGSGLVSWCSALVSKVGAVDTIAE
ncbi:Probable cadmium-transporting ATPase (Cadmium-efflux ATPase) [Durusdinium trenchii]|uniref:Probable cadmium-transporting ATPase (Cadmium-efflux ATPase) n=1 Tax=Durusdinium trenchii TaxID=1381693 RepID=A0ABP0M2D5_9DINO